MPLQYTPLQVTHEAPAAIPIAREKDRVSQLVECNKLLEEVQKGLAAYLEKKRCVGRAGGKSNDADWVSSGAIIIFKTSAVVR
jgi:hypothetical protein